NPDKIKKEMKIIDWKNIFDELSKDLIWVEFTGGEPLLKKNIVEIITYCYNNTSIIAGGLITNAVSPKRSYLYIKRIIKQIKSNKIFNVGISLDGVPEIHDKLRGIKNNFENVIWLWKRLNELKKQYKNLHIHFAYTISYYNAGNFKKFYNYLTKNFNTTIEDITITMQHTSFFYKKNKNKIQPHNKKLIKNIKKDVYEYMHIFKKNKFSKLLFINTKLIFYKFYLKKLQIFLENPEKMVIPCAAGTFSSYIDPYGNIYPCIQWDIKFGNLKKYSLKKIWWNVTTEEKREQITQGKCPNCWTPCEAQPSFLSNFPKTIIEEVLR
ncbi:MAG: SPASM domain-containing protein, partial [Candidatus Hodarchaeota archaeon]